MPCPASPRRYLRTITWASELGMKIAMKVRRRMRAQYANAKCKPTMRPGISARLCTGFRFSGLGCRCPLLALATPPEACLVCQEHQHAREELELGRGVTGESSNEAAASQRRAPTCVSRAPKWQSRHRGVTEA
jgi:hypothetical protein